ncbi:hypothetical protein [Rhizobium sp. SG570]|uniref:hypothetical protein n=1 Tax=Rhizobium sp. SG570 TaxID=2587113 RepID=UPI0014476D4B|nr:hypothetical protein [Rhizobium sp. SG570]NKJ36406.1 hypothetical protein [Rhizobium sp. SG570]NRP90210.1 hypothetical protein [Ensifer adhaerens]
MTAPDPQRSNIAEITLPSGRHPDITMPCRHGRLALIHLSCSLVRAIVLYRDRFDSQGPIARFLTRNAFGVYVLNAPILVAITRSLHFLPASMGPKFALASLGGILASFLIVGFVARRIPGLRAVL